MTRQQLNHYIETEQWDFIALWQFIERKLHVGM
jgi:hypothetical protein